MVEEIGESIGMRRIPAFERKVREQLAETNPGGGNATDWIQAMAEVIVENDDKRADLGFRKGIRRIRAMGGDA